MLNNNPRNISVKRNGMRLTAATFNKITCEELHWHLYKVKVRQQLKKMIFNNVHISVIGLFSSATLFSF